MAVATAGLVIALPAVSAQAMDPEPDVVVNANSRLCLEIGGWSTADGAGVDQWSCLYNSNGNPDANQAWQYVPVNGYYQIRNANSGKCLEVQGWGTGNGATVDQWDCLYDGNGNPDANQEWSVGAGRIMNVNSGKCLEVNGWAAGNGAGVDQWDCLTNGSGQIDANQQWSVLGPYNM